MADYQMFLAREIEGRLKDKCDKLADAIVDDTGKIFITSRLRKRSLVPYPNSFVSNVILGLNVKLCADNDHNFLILYIK